MSVETELLLQNNNNSAVEYTQYFVTKSSANEEMVYLPLLLRPAQPKHERFQRSSRTQFVV